MPAGATPGTLRPEIFRLAVEVCPGGMIVAGSDGAMLLVNGEIERLFGYGRDELLGRSIDVLLPERMRGKHARQRRAFAAHPEARHFGTGRDLNARRKDGSEFPVEVALNPLRAGGEMMIIAAIVDIGERKRLERMQDEFVATVSHELRTPMTSIAASLGLLLAGGSQGLPRPAVHLIEIAYANCQRLVRTVSDILDFKKLDAGQMPFHFQRCGARALLEKAVEANRGFAESRGVTMKIEAAPASIEIEVDPDRFMQLITNLLSNAIKFSPDGEVVGVALEARGDNVRITVRDHGPGIPAEFKPRMFQAFAQAAGGGGQKGGTGLGLSIARQIANRMHGQVGFDDAPGGGTAFHIDLPDADHVARWQEELAPQAGQAPAATKGGR